jgi:hypothetical protein
MVDRLPNFGLGTEQIDVPTEFRLSDHAILVGITIGSTARDGENTPTTTLRRGLVMGKITASGKYAQYSDAATDGTGVAAGILVHEADLLGPYASAHDATGLILVHGYVKESALIGIDANGKADMKHVMFG